MIVFELRLVSDDGAWEKECHGCAYLPRQGETVSLGAGIVGSVNRVNWTIGKDCIFPTVYVGAYQVDPWEGWAEKLIERGWKKRVLEAKGPPKPV